MAEIRRMTGKAGRAALVALAAAAGLLFGLPYAALAMLLVGLLFFWIGGAVVPIALTVGALVLVYAGWFAAQQTWTTLQERSDADA